MLKKDKNGSKLQKWTITYMNEWIESGDKLLQQHQDSSRDEEGMRWG